MDFSPLLLQASLGTAFNQLFPLLLVFLAFWLIIIYPQNKRRKAQAEFMNNLAKGDQVVTTGGIIGKINKIDDEMITIEAGKTFIPVTRGSISKEMTDAIFKED